MTNVLVDSTDTSSMGLKEILASVNVFVSNLRAPRLVLRLPVHSDCLVGVQRVDGFRGFSEVVNAVVTSVLVNVVKNLGRLLSVVEKPSDSMSKVTSIVEANALVASRDTKTNGTVLNSGDFTGLRTITEVIPKGCRYDGSSHVEFTLTVVRGPEGCSLLFPDSTISPVSKLKTTGVLRSPLLFGEMQ